MDNESLTIIGKKMEQIGKFYVRSVATEDNKSAARYRIYAHECLDAYFDCMQDMVDAAIVLGQEQKDE